MHTCNDNVRRNLKICILTVDCIIRVFAKIMYIIHIDIVVIAFKPAH